MDDKHTMYASNELGMEGRGKTQNKNPEKLKSENKGRIVGFWLPPFPQLMCRIADCLPIFLVRKQVGRFLNVVEWVSLVGVSKKWGGVVVGHVGWVARKEFDSPGIKRLG